MPASYDVLANGGEMGALMRAHDWAATPVGPPSAWTQALRTMVRLLLASRHPMFIFWGEAHTCFYNDAYRRTMGPERHPGSLGQPGRQAWDEVWSVIGPEIEQVLGGGEATWHEDHLVPITRHGRREDVWWTYCYSPIDCPAAPGGIGGVLVICNDVTREHLAREGLREAEARLLELNRTLERRIQERTAERNLLAKVVEATDVMIMAVDLDYNILAINPSNADEFERIYGVRPKVGDNMLALLTDQPGHQAQVQATWARGLAGEETTIVEDFGDPARVRPSYEIKFRTLRNEAGQRIGCYQFVTDVTDRLRKQAQLAEAQEALRQSQKMEAVGQLTGGIAHDFNNMLQAIGGSLELMQRRVEQGRAGEAGRYVDSARATVGRASALTGRLLAFARRQTLQPKPVIADALIGGMEELLRRTAGPAVTVELRMCDGNWPVLCDPNQLENVLLNLAINARDAMQDGGRLTITTRHVCLSDADVANQEGAAPGDFVEIAVADMGTGMDEATRARAFEPFFTTKPIGQGTGLGLSQLYGFVRQSGGVVELDSALNQGTTVRVLLPRQDQADGEGVTPTPGEEPSKAGHGETVLLVEDEAEVRAAAAEHLRDLGYVVLEVADGPAALRVLRSSRHVDLLVTDVGLPGGMNGRQVADVGRERRPGLPALFITGYAGSVLQEQLASGMDVIGKPFSLGALAARVRVMLDAAHALRIQDRPDR